MGSLLLQLASAQGGRWARGLSVLQGLGPETPRPSPEAFSGCVQYVPFVWLSEFDCIFLEFSKYPVDFYKKPAVGQTEQSFLFEKNSFAGSFILWVVLQKLTDCPMVSVYAEVFFQMEIADGFRHCQKGRVTWFILSGPSCHWSHVSFLNQVNTSQIHVRNQVSSCQLTCISLANYRLTCNQKTYK